MDDELGEQRFTIDKYYSELVNSSYIKQNTSKDVHLGHLRRLQKLHTKVTKVKGRLDRLRKHRDPDFTGLVLSEDERRYPLTTRGTTR